MSIQTLVDRLETYGFQCEAGNLQWCVEWQELKAALARLEQEMREYAQQVGSRSQVINEWADHQLATLRGKE